MGDAGDRRRRPASILLRLQAVIQTVFPFVIVGFGAIVMFIVVALFLPLVALIQKLA